MSTKGIIEQLANNPISLEITKNDFKSFIKDLEKGYGKCQNVAYFGGGFLKALYERGNFNPKTFLEYLNQYDELQTNLEGIEFINQLKNDATK